MFAQIGNTPCPCLTPPEFMGHVGQRPAPREPRAIEVGFRVIAIVDEVRVRWVSNNIQLDSLRARGRFRGLYTGSNVPARRGKARARSAPNRLRGGQSAQSVHRKMRPGVPNLNSSGLCRPRRHSTNKLVSALAPAHPAVCLIAMFAEFDRAQATIPRPWPSGSRHGSISALTTATPPGWAARQNPRGFFPRDLGDQFATPLGGRRRTGGDHGNRQGCAYLRQREKISPGWFMPISITRIRYRQASARAQRHAPVVVIAVDRGHAARP